MHDLLVRPFWRQCGYIDQILYDGAKELAQNESDSSQYVVSPTNKVWLSHSLF